MVRNILILCGPQGADRYAAELAAEAGDDLGRIHTGIDPSQVKATGCRIEEDRDFGGRVMGTFDEPIEVGAAIAQLVGHADAVIVDHLNDWAGRLTTALGDDDAIESELTSVVSVMNAGLADVLLLAEVPTAGAAAPEESSDRLFRHMLERLQPLCDVVVDLSSGEPDLRRGSLTG